MYFDAEAMVDTQIYKYSFKNYVTTLCNGDTIVQKPRRGKKDLYSVRENCCKPATVPHDVTFPQEKIVFCYKNCSELLWEKVVLLIEKKLFKFKAEGQEFQKICDH